jgi:nitrate reductase NapE component
MKRFLAGSVAYFQLASAHAQAQEPAVEPNTLATAIFLVLFVGFCAGFAWMVWRNKDKKKE